MAAKQLDLFKKNQMSYRTPLMVAGSSVSTCLLLFLAWGIYVYWDSPQLITFLSSWIPFALSVLLALMPAGKEMRKPWVRHSWRAGVVFIGFCWSVLLWHQQSLTDITNMLANQQLLNQAIQKSNEHSDGQFRGVQKNVGTLGDQVTELDHSLKGITKTLTDAVQQSSDRLDAAIGKVGKPVPPEVPKLRFSLWRDGLLANEFPLESINLQPDKDGALQISFVVKNDSGVQAEGVELWVYICNVCSFVKEPTGFDKPEGLNERARHRSIPAINPGVAIREGNTIAVKVNQTGISRTQVLFKSTCKTCGPIETSKEFLINIEPNLTPP